MVNVASTVIGAVDTIIANAISLAGIRNASPDLVRSVAADSRMIDGQGTFPSANAPICPMSRVVVADFTVVYVAGRLRKVYACARFPIRGLRLLGCPCNCSGICRR